MCLMHELRICSNIDLEIDMSHGKERVEQVFRSFRDDYLDVFKMHVGSLFNINMLLR